MKTNQIEQLDKARYNAVKWLTISFVFFYCPIMVNYIMGYLNVDKFYKIYINLPILFVGVVLFQISVIKLVVIIKKINSNSEYKQVLNDELFAVNQSKSFRNFFISFLLVMFLTFLLASIYPNIPTMFVCYLIAFIQIMVLMISWLKYNR